MMLAPKVPTRGRGLRRGALCVVAGAALAITPLALPSYASNGAGSGGGGRFVDAGDQAAELMDSQAEFAQARSAPTGLVAPGAYAAAYSQLSSLPAAPSSWSSITNVPYNSDDPRYRDPSASNSSGGAGYVSGRVQALAVDGHCVFAGGAAGGIERSCDNGTTWTPIADALPTQSIGSMSIAPDGALWVATGDGTTGSATYVGAGVFRLGSPDTSTFTAASKVGGTELDSQVIRRILIDADNGRVFVAASRGLYVHSLAGATTTAWSRSLAPCAQGMLSCTDVNANYRDIANDVAVQPGTGGQVVLANVAWRSGAAYNGFYLSRDGGATWAKVNPLGAINPKDVGNATIQYSADGSRLYVVLESPSALIAGAASALAGVYVSDTGAAAGPYNQIANPSTLAQSGSAERKQRIGKGYAPGVQSWYNQFIGVDPANAKHVYVGLEEVYESWDGGASWKTIGRYWDFGFSCWSNVDANNTCDGNVLHSDQHTIAFGSGTSAGQVYVGNDGGLYQRAVSPTASSWRSLSRSGQLNLLQYYSVGVGKDVAHPGQVQVWGGLQDNGVSLLDPANNGTMVSPYGGDGGQQLVDPDNGCRTVGEYVDLTLQMTTNCGVADGSPASDSSIVTIAPADPLPRFIAPFSADQTDSGTWVAGGEYVWTNTKTWASTSGADWTKAADTGAGHSITALASRNHVVWAGWCGSCNPGSSFARGLMTNANGSYQQVATTAGVPRRMVTGVTPDPADPRSSYVVFGGYSRNWVDGPGSDLAGSGHLWKVTVTGGTDSATGQALATWTDVSGNLPDVPGDNLLITSRGRVVLATDLGVVETTLASLRTGAPQWSRDAIPVTIATQALEGPDGKLYVATYGRGIYRTAS
ncbi:MAG: glycosyl hydrolase [Dermatophilaceae bacterium]|nr:glycosyl hydrolase [Dermatophilaceae bacterium]